MQMCCRDILNNILEERILKNPSYSMRSFAKDIGMSPASISSFLNGKRGLSKEMATKVAQKLPLLDFEKKRFIQLAVSQYSRSKDKRNRALKKLMSEPALNKIRKTNVKETLIKSWHYLALLELIAGGSYKLGHLESISKRIGLNEKSVSHLIDEMLSLEVLRLNKKNILEDNLGNLEVEDSPGSESLRKFHSQILDLASKALVNQSSEDLYSQSVVFSINKKMVPEINKEIKEFLRRINEIIGSSNGEEVLRCLTIQSFVLEKV